MGMLPDAVDLVSDEQKRLYVSLLILVCAADGELVREEMAALESAMGSALIHPEARGQLRQLLVNLPRPEDIFARLEESTARLALRDGFIIAACDGDYAPEELEFLSRIHTASGLPDETMSELIDWVETGWKWHAVGRNLVDTGLLGDEQVLDS